MSVLRQKINEASRSLLPVMALVLLLSFTLVSVGSDTLLRFLLGSFLLLVGLALFLLGVDLAMYPIGEHMASEVATSKTALKVAALSFLLGFLVTVAEPDLMILGKQVEAASGGTFSAMALVYIVSAGVGLLIFLGTFRLLSGRMSYRLFMGISYAIMLVLALFVSEEFLAVSFDSSGATTGTLTTPFILALSAGLSRIKGGKRTEEDSFGLVGVMSAGPIIAVMLMSILTKQGRIQGEAEVFAVTRGVLGPMLRQIPAVFFESLMALLPLTALFFMLHFIRFKLLKNEIIRILKGLVYTLFGLALFLTGVYSGFMDMGQIIGRGIALHHAWLLPVVGFLLGTIIVLVEPAVHVLGNQIEDATGGRIPLKMIRITLSLGVAFAIAASMARIMVPGIKLWYFLLPGFSIAVILSFFAEPVFVGIAYDAGGVASGPLTATFVLAFAQGAAAMTPTANVLIDGFGVIAMVAMAPVISIMILGVIFKRKVAVNPQEEIMISAPASLLLDPVVQYDCVVAVIKRGLSERAIELAREVGAAGATILHGRGSGGHDAKLFHMELQKEKELVFWLTDTLLSAGIAAHLYHELELGGEVGGTVFVLPAGAMGINAPLAIGTGIQLATKDDQRKAETPSLEDILPSSDTQNNEV